MKSNSEFSLHFLKVQNKKVQKLKKFGPKKIQIRRINGKHMIMETINYDV